MKGEKYEAVKTTTQAAAGQVVEEEFLQESN